MPKSFRSKNLDLIRWMNSGHKPTAKKLAPVVSETHLSKMATGDMDVSDRKARSIESKIGLPTGWLDRKNEAVLKMSVEDYEIFCRLIDYTVDEKTALIKILSHK